MSELRGAMPDAECPRCGERRPPPASALATCPTCGLVFVPHEIEHPLSPPRPLPDPPPPLTAVRERGSIVMRVPLLRWTAPFAVAGMLFTTWLVLFVRETPWWGLGLPLGLAVLGFAYLTLAAIVSSHVVTIGADSISHHISPLPVALARRVPRRGVITVELGADPSYGVFALHLQTAHASTMLVRLRHRAALHYIAALIASESAIHLRDRADSGTHTGAQTPL